MLFDLGEQNKIQKGKHENLFNTETMMQVSEIKDNTILLKDSGLRAILKVEGLNLDLKNYDEVNVILEQYKRFLNGLSFPIQIVVRNDYLDLSEYLQYLSINLKQLTNPTLKQQGQKYFDFLENIDAKQGMIFTKSFYIVVPYYPGEADKSEIKKGWFSKLLGVLNTKDSVEQIITRYRTFLKGKHSLDSRCNILIDGLNGIGLSTKILSTAEIISLLFSFYNPLLHKSQSRLQR
ncbi:MAG: hypothetical protein CR971_02415 [candidate division SR1 bacterium]|nr:MAG: hypothetical protein CR971_02415 [candidate division SR1 bacterium]